MGKRNHYGDSFGRGISAKNCRGNIKKLLEVYGEKAVDAGKAELKNQAGVLVEAVKSNIKTQNLIKTGNLLNSIKATANKQETEYRISADAQDKKGFYYGQILEFSPKINKPFMYPAFLKHQQNIRDSIMAAMRKGLEGG